MKKVISIKNKVAKFFAGTVLTVNEAAAKGLIVFTGHNN